MRTRDPFPPVLRGSVEDLASVWTWDEAVAICELPGSLADYPELSLRIRGAWGRALRASPGRARRSTFGSRWGRAVEMLATPFAFLPDGTEVPKPAIIRAYVEHKRLVVRLRLFGAAALHLPEAAEALATALEGGISLAPEVRERTPVVIERMLTGREGQCRLPDFAVGSAVLVLRSPLAVRAGNQLRPDGEAVLRSLPTRIASMAYWQRFVLESDWQNLLSSADRIVVDTALLRTYLWKRHSQRQGDTPIPMGGHLGKLGLTGTTAPFVPFLALAETCNTGSHASLGLGWYDLSLYPHLN